MTAPLCMLGVWIVGIPAVVIAAAVHHTRRRKPTPPVTRSRPVPATRSRPMPEPQPNVECPMCGHRQFVTRPQFVHGLPRPACRQAKLFVIHGYDSAAKERVRQTRARRDEEAFQLEVGRMLCDVEDYLAKRALFDVWRKEHAR